MPVRKTSKKSEESPLLEPTPSTAPKPISKTDPFTILIQEISKLQTEFEKLQKEISQAKEAWSLEQRNHEQEIADRNHQEEVTRKRDRETYEYEMSRRQKQAEDEFTDKKAAWEKALNEQKETIEKDKKELEELRKVVGNFEAEQEKAIAATQANLRKELTTNFETEKKLREQEMKAEKEILTLKINNVTAEASRQAAEIDDLKKALDEATKQVKDIAVKVIEASSPNPKTTTIFE